MTSDRKIESNRKNAQKSTGPRSEAGQRRSRRNALRHGLAIAIGSDSALSEDVKRLASALARGRSGSNISEFAHQAAEAEIDLLRIRKLRASRFNAVLGNPETKLGDHSEFKRTRQARTIRATRLRAAQTCISGNDRELRDIAGLIALVLNHVAGRSQPGFEPMSVGQFAQSLEFCRKPGGNRLIGASAGGSSGRLPSLSMASRVELRELWL